MSSELIAARQRYQHPSTPASVMKMHPQDIFLDTVVFASTIHWFALAIERLNDQFLDFII
jgi:hypothetical protein